MITIDKLTSIGIRPEEGLGRCMNNEEFFLNLVASIPSNEGFASLHEALERGDLEAGFEAAHSLKGVLGNLSLNTLYEPMVELTEHLRARDNMDYSQLIGQIDKALAQLKEQCE